MHTKAVFRSLRNKEVQLEIGARKKEQHTNMFEVHWINLLIGIVRTNANNSTKHNKTAIFSSQNNKMDE